MFQKDRHDKSMVSWQTRILASFIAGGYMVDGKTGNPALDAAQKLAFDDIEAAQIEDAAKATVKKKVTEPAIGSYERFMGAFGGKLSS